MSDPSTAEELGHIPDMGLAETKEAIAAATKAFKTWSKTTAKVRTQLFKRFGVLRLFRT